MKVYVIITKDDEVHFVPKTSSNVYFMGLLEKNKAPFPVIFEDTMHRYFEHVEIESYTEGVL